MPGFAWSAGLPSNHCPVLSTHKWNRRAACDFPVLTGSTVIYGQSQDGGIVLYNQGTCNVTVSLCTMDICMWWLSTDTQSIVGGHRTGNSCRTGQSTPSVRHRYTRLFPMLTKASALLVSTTVYLCLIPHGAPLQGPAVGGARAGDACQAVTVTVPALAQYWALADAAQNAVLSATAPPPPPSPPPPTPQRYDQRPTSTRSSSWSERRPSLKFCVCRGRSLHSHRLTASWHHKRCIAQTQWQRHCKHARVT